MSSEQNAISPASLLPPAVNFHLEKACNLKCRFCFATFNDDEKLRAIRHGLPAADCAEIAELLRLAGVQKLNFVGGEPTLNPNLPSLLRHAKALGFVTSLVTNGARLSHVLDQAHACIDWVGLSVDSACEDVQAELGRGNGDHVAKSVAHFERLRSLAIRTKLNTVVTTLNWQEDMSDFVLMTRPERWKIFQTLPVDGQNSGRVEELQITPVQFDEFVRRHLPLRSCGVQVVPESNEVMTGSYAMIDPLGRFFSNVGGRHIYSRPILEVGVSRAFQDIAFDRGRFERRGGTYDWSGAKSVQLLQLNGV